MLPLRKTQVTFYILMFLVVKTVDLSHIHRTSTISDESVYQKYITMDMGLKRIVDSAVKSVLPYAMEVNERLNISSQCRNNLLRWLTDIRRLKLSAFKILDATAKFPEGVLEGRLFFPGDFEECMTISSTDKENIDFKTQYCVLRVKPPVPSKDLQKPLLIKSEIKPLMEALKNTSEFVQFLASKAQVFYYAQANLGICIPRGCSENDISGILNLLGERLDVSAEVIHCKEENNDDDLPAGFSAAMSVMVFLGVTVVISSVVDYVCKEKKIVLKNTGMKILLCFSLHSNFPKLISIENKAELSSLYGIRCLSLFYTILTHQYMLSAMTVNQAHIFVYFDRVSSFFFQIVTSGILTTENFFFIGGLVNCYTRMKINDISKRQLSRAQLLFLRAWRMYPAFLFITFFGEQILRNIYGSFMFVKVFGNCHRVWWKNLLFINNFFDVMDVCLGHTWYVCADMQLFVISLFTIPYFFRNPRIGVMLHAGIILIGHALTIGWVWYKNVLPAIIVLSSDQDEWFRYRNAFTATPSHIGPYFIGILFGYFLYKRKDYKIPKVYQVTGWLGAGFIYFSMFFITQRWNSGAEYSRLEGCFYFAFSKSLYVLGAAWLVVCCTMGYGGVVNYILSLSIWIPITRISYMMYLVSLVIQAFYFGNSRLASDSNRMVMIWQFFGDLMTTFLLSVVLSLVIESPCIAMEKFFIRKIPAQKTQDPGGRPSNDVISSHTAYRTKIEENNS